MTDQVFRAAPEPLFGATAGSIETASSYWRWPRCKPIRRRRAGNVIETRLVETRLVETPAAAAAESITAGFEVGEYSALYALPDTTRD